MQLKTFEAATLPAAIAKVRDTLGEDALIVSTDRIRRGKGVRITAAVKKAQSAAPGFDIDTKAFNGEPTDDPIPLLRAALADNGVTEDLADRLLEAASFVSTPIAPALALAAALESAFDFLPLGKRGGRIVTDEGLRRATLLVGPPGAGKTVTAAKMAARAARAGNGVRLISVDTLKTGGMEHLNALAEALGIGMRFAGDASELAALVAGSTGDVSIIDTAGINPFDSVDADHLAAMIAEADVEPILVMPAGLDHVDAVETAHAFAKLNCRRMIITRVDMTRRLGSVLEAAYQAGLAFADVSVSPEIIGRNGGGLGTLNPVALARLMLPAQLLHSDNGYGLAEPAAKRTEGI